jgi:hypothetical protein
MNTTGGAIGELLVYRWRVIKNARSACIDHHREWLIVRILRSLQKLRG